MAVGSELEAPIQRIFYLRHEGRQRDHEVFPDPNPALLADLEACDAVLYGMGSLYTSICPSLILQVHYAQSPFFRCTTYNHISENITQLDDIAK